VRRNPASPNLEDPVTLKAEARENLEFARQCFDNSTRVLADAERAFSPTPESMTVIGHVVHVARTIDWFREGGFDGVWRMEFGAMVKEGAKVTSLAEARAMLRSAWDRLGAVIDGATDAVLAAELPTNPILQGRRYHVIEGILDHTAHHRGALAVYARLQGKTPAMPYGEG
jgi:uncharacterized damage-inducible protein DinB